MSWSATVCVMWTDSAEISEYLEFLPFWTNFGLPLLENGSEFKIAFGLPFLSTVSLLFQSHFPFL
jgi:hypothetical protein